MTNLVAIILAAGKGERLKPYSTYYQKCILPIEGKPLLVYWIEALKNQSQHIFVNIFYGHHYPQVIDIAHTWERLHYDEEVTKAGDIPKYELGVNPVPMLPRDKVWKDVIFFYDVRSYLKDRPMLLCLGDNYSKDLNQVVCGVLKHQNTLSDDVQGIIGLIPQRECSSKTEEAVLSYSGANELHSIKEYRHGGTERVSIDSFAWSGIGLFSPKVLEMREPNTTSELFSLLAKEGTLFGQIIKQVYFDIGTPEGYARTFK